MAHNLDDLIKDPKTGRFLPGHRAHPKAGRPPGAVAKLSRSLREQAIDGLGDIAEFVRELKESNPAAAAGLLARMLPPGDAEGTLLNCAPLVVNITPVPADRYLAPADVRRLTAPLEPEPVVIDHVDDEPPAS